jgi:hypothetical protein
MLKPNEYSIYLFLAIEMKAHHAKWKRKKKVFFIWLPDVVHKANEDNVKSIAIRMINSNNNFPLLESLSRSSLYFFSEFSLKIRL